MAETIVNTISKQLGEEQYGPCVTKHLHFQVEILVVLLNLNLLFTKKQELQSLMGFQEKKEESWLKLYGSNVDRVFQYAHILQSVKTSIFAIKSTSANLLCSPL